MKYQEAVKSNSYLYSLRLTLPPWCWREMLDELKRYCVKCKIDEVCIKIDTGTFTHSYPSEEWLRNYQKILFTIRDELKEIGVRYSLNPNVTQGHGDRGRHIDRQHPDWNMITGSDGTKATDCACAASPGWREYMKMQWGIYAETKPDLIWIEDDIRHSHHGPVKDGCYCDEHMRRFNLKYATSYSREQLVKALSASGAPAPERKMWLDHLKDMTEETVSFLEKTVHELSPDTIIGLMSSGPEFHAREGRNWSELFKKMSGAGNIPVASRPPLGSYTEEGMEGLIYTANMPRFTRAAFKEHTIEEGEIENYPYTGFAKSNLFMFLQCAAVLSCGCEALTFNLYDHCGTPLSATGDILESMGKNKKLLSAIKEKAGTHGKSSGVHLYFNPETGKSKHFTSEQKMESAHSDALSWSRALQVMGIAISFEDSYITALGGQDIRAASKDEIMSMLRQGVLCDAKAFQALTEMGYGDYLGAQLKSSFPLMTKYPLAGEHFFNESFGGRKNHYFSLSIHPGHPIFIETELAQGAIELSEIVDPDTKRVFPGTFIFENRIGGRVAVLPFEVNKLDSGFADPCRKKMLHTIVQWLGKGNIPMTVSGDRRMLPIRQDFGTHSLCSIFNLSHDKLRKVKIKIDCPRKVSEVEILNAKGVWKSYYDYKHENETLAVSINSISFDKPVFLNVQYAGE